MNNYSKIVSPNINQLIQDHTNLVKKISWHLHGRVNSIIEIEDIIQIGMLGLISAAQNYIPQKDASFASYASIRAGVTIRRGRNTLVCRAVLRTEPPPKEYWIASPKCTSQ